MKRQTIKCFVYFFSFLLPAMVCAQDKIYKTDGSIFEGKVTKVSSSQIHVTLPNGPEYVMNNFYIDSIVYGNGRRDLMPGYTYRVNMRENIPQLNTWDFDMGGIASLSVSQYYERRLKDGKVGFRIPLYVGFMGGGIAGVGTFYPGQGVYYPVASIYTSTTKSLGFSIATGFNPKFYFFKHRIVRVFAGPEADIGYSVITGYPGGNNSNYNYNNYNNASVIYVPDVHVYRCGTFAMLASFGINLILPFMARLAAAMYLAAITRLVGRDCGR